MPVLGMIIAAVVACATVVVLAWAMARRRAAERLRAAGVEAAVAIRGGRSEAAATSRKAETQGREAALALRASAREELAAAAEDLAARDEQLGERLAVAAEELRDLDQRSAAIDERFTGVRALRDRARDLRRDAGTLRAEARELLEERAGISADQVAMSMARRWLEEARADAAQRLRVIDQGLSDIDFEARARRLMEIAISRYTNHFLTERSISKLPLGEGVADLLTAEDGRIKRAVEEVANVQLHLSDDGESLRFEGLDGVGREVARRALNRLAKKSEARQEARQDPGAWAASIQAGVDREIRALGARAFNVLKVQRPHPEIVALVGALNFRTSYTQNQWRHAVEAAFLCSIMADELALDRKLARRAALLHDIGKALTHQMDGSHAVIGAAIAREHGEGEVVANAIASHHLDEPIRSAYASLVAAADAMSGARPGARRELAEGYTSRLQDLERIGSGYRGVDRAYAVHGGRELRVYVRDDQVSDEQAAELAAKIAAQISEELTFPGQIKVTAIRAFEALSTAS